MTLDQGPHRPTLPERGKSCVLLDFDGTLVDIAPTPDAVTVPAGLEPLLNRAVALCGGRVALVSGRALADLDHFLPGYRGEVIAGHGAQIRMQGQRHDTTPPPAALQALMRDVTACAHSRSGTLLERKDTGAVLHWRAVPAREAQLMAEARRIAAAHPDFVLQPGKCVAEFKPKGVSKAEALRRWQAHLFPPGITPIYAGDDLTDEPALDYVHQAGGIAIHIGPGDTCAPYRLPDPGSLLKELEHWLA